MSPRRLVDLERGERRKALIRTVAIIGLAWVAFLVVYYVAPAASGTAISAFPRLGVSLGVVAGVLMWQLGRIGRAELPELRAFQALGVIIPLFLALFATLYLSVSHSSPSSFSEPLDHTRALYFTITVLSTVGFGDITPRTDPTRIMVSIQMLLDLVLIGVVVRVIFSAARMSLARGSQDAGNSP